jgi:transposase
VAVTSVNGATCYTTPASRCGLSIRRVRNFALSAGRLAKNDPIDAEMIAWFAETFSQAPGQIPDAAREELAGLAKARKALMDVKIRLQAQNEHAAPEPARKAHARILKSLAAEIDKLDVTAGVIPRVFGGTSW